MTDPILADMASIRDFYGELHRISFQTAPIPNFDLERLLLKGFPSQITEYENPIYRDSDEELEETIFE